MLTKLLITKNSDIYLEAAAFLPKQGTAWINSHHSHYTISKAKNIIKEHSSLIFNNEKSLFKRWLLIIVECIYKGLILLKWRFLFLQKVKSLSYLLNVIHFHICSLPSRSRHVLSTKSFVSSTVTHNKLIQVPEEVTRRLRAVTYL